MHVDVAVAGARDEEVDANGCEAKGGGVRRVRLRAWPAQGGEEGRPVEGKWWQGWRGWRIGEGWAVHVARYCDMRG